MLHFCFFIMAPGVFLFLRFQLLLVLGGRFGLFYCFYLVLRTVFIRFLIFLCRSSCLQNTSHRSRSWALVILIFVLGGWHFLYCILFLQD